MGFALFTTLLPSMVTSSPIMEVTSDGTYEERLQAAAIAAAGTQINLPQAELERSAGACGVGLRVQAVRGDVHREAAREDE
jgi:hypothetical protein